MGFITSVILSMGIDCLVAVFVIVIYFIFCRKTNTDRRLMTGVFMLYIAALFSVTGIPAVTGLTLDISVNLIPFRDFFSSPEGYILNVIMFIPMGFLLPVIWKRLRAPWKTALAGLCLSLSVEILQLFTFRTTDIDDLITNTIGTFVGYVAAAAVNKFSEGRLYSGGKENVKELFGVCIMIFAVAFLIAPLISYAVWNIVLA